MIIDLYKKIWYNISYPNARFSSDTVSYISLNSDENLREFEVL